MRFAPVALTVLALAVCSSAGAASIPRDPDRGRELLKTHQCVTCHSLAGEGAKAAPDLAQPQSRDYSPAELASRLWNHAPAMWSAMQQKRMAIPKFTVEDSGDLYAFLYTMNYFEMLGDAGRGRQAFEAKSCADCHGKGAAIKSGAVPVDQWTSIKNPIALATAMWNHSVLMRAELRKRGKKWPQLTSREFRDIVLYLNTLPSTRGRAPALEMAAPDTGQRLFEMKGCAGCHKGARSLENKFTNRSLVDFALSMWNHAPMGAKTPALNENEMRRILGYLWSIQTFEEAGNPQRGESLFASKSCAKCHGDGGSAPKLRASTQRWNSLHVVAALWQHGPQMHAQMSARNMPWPRLEAADIADLLAYFNRK